MKQEIKNRILQLANSQEFGIEYRYNCFVCGDTRRRLYIKKEVNKIYAHCFNGGCQLNRKGLIIPLSITSENISKYLSDINNQFVNKNNNKSKFKLTLNKNIPKKYVNYLLKYLPQKAIDKIYKSNLIGYDEYRDRLAVECSGGYILRSLTEKPKWLKLGAKYFLIGKSKLYNSDGKLNLVIVEDVISAIRLYDLLSVASLSLLGTKPIGEVKTWLRRAVMKSEGNVWIWLDDDIAGMRGAIDLYRNLTGYKTKISLVKYPEPKLISDTEIINNIKGGI